MHKPLPRSPSAESSKPFAIYEEVTDPVPDLLVREPIGDYSILPKELADLTYDSAGLSRVDDFVTRFDDAPSAALVNALSMYLCDYLVVSHGLTWRLTPTGTALLQLDSRGDIADPTPGVTQALENRQPIAHRFVEHCRGDGIRGIIDT